MQEVLPADRADLAGAEAAGRGHGAQELGDDPGVVVGHAEQSLPAAVAREEQRRLGLLAREQRPQVLVGGGGVADVELDGATDGDLLADGDRAGLAVAADQVADEEVAAAEVDPVLVDDDAEVQALLEQRALLVGRARGELAESLERRPPGERADEVLAPTRSRRTGCRSAGSPARRPCGCPRPRARRPPRRGRRPCRRPRAGCRPERVRPTPCRR